MIDTLHETMGARKIPQIETRYPGKHILVKIDGLGAEKTEFATSWNARKRN